MAGILDIGVSGLLSFQNALNTTGHNIANSDTEGYSRQRTLLSTQVPQLTGAGWIGSGVKVAGIDRMYDNFLATQVRSTQSVSSQLQAYLSYSERIDNVLADPNIGLDPAIQSFFDATQVLADDPSSIPSRQVVLSEANSLADRFHDLGRQFTGLRGQLNNELESVTREINDLAESLSRVNQSIIESIGAAGGDDPNDLLDKREVLLNELAKRVEITVVPQDDGAWNVFIGKGQSLVIGPNASTLGTQPGATDSDHWDVTFTDTVGSRVITDQLTGGEIGGLLDFRDQILDPGQNQLGLVAIGISERLNAQHNLGIDLNGALGGQLFSTPQITVAESSGNGGAASVAAATIVDSGALTASDYLLKAGAVGYTLTRLTDGQSWNYVSGDVRDGFSLTLAGAADPGDEFLIQPTRNAPLFMELQINDPRRLAAAGPLRAGPDGNRNDPGPNQGDASVSQPRVSNAASIDSATNISLVFDANNNRFDVDLDGNGAVDLQLAYDPSTDGNGKQFVLAGYGDPAFSVSGSPVDGDSFVISFNQGGIGDNRNALALAELQFQDTLLGSGGGSGTATFQEVFGQMVSDVGSKSRHARVNAEATDGLLERHQMSLSSISGVNLDEEAANLIRFQQAYQASAQVISVANTLFDTLLGAVRR
ncbi:MAG: flagellar hook-associated protein FlgK [Gammaproteobacteria bacterium]|nr:flagellar hook-associated protein FlgK [Gammaproteobacteria bacterium]